MVGSDYYCCGPPQYVNTEGKSHGASRREVHAFGTFTKMQGGTTGGATQAGRGTGYTITGDHSK